MRFLSVRTMLWFTLLVSPGVVVAQSTANLYGTVKDPSGAVLPGAEIVVHANATGTDRTVTTDSAGTFTVPSLQPGEYNITAQAAGFSKYEVRNFVLQVDQKAALNIGLGVQAAGETVEVTGGAPAIETATITVGTVIDKRTVQEIPLNGRHFMDLTVLTPGGVTPPANGTLTAPSRGLGSNSFVTAGNREDAVNFQINGVNLNDQVQNQITFQPSINTTSEFKINNSTYSAEYGRSSGSIVNVSTRSGTNQFHGEAFDYNRNNSFDTRNFFNPKGTAQNALKRNNFGGALGGPIWRERAFFFGSYEGLRQHQGLPLQATVLTPADRAGVTDPVAQQLLALIPAGTPNPASSASYLSSTVQNGPVQTDQGTVDVLGNLRQSDTLHGFYAIQKDVRTEPNLQGNTVSGFGDHRVASRQILTINETHVFSARLANEARIGFNRVAIQFVPNVSIDPSTLGLNNYPTGVAPGGGIPQITITGYSLNFGGPSLFPQGRSDTLGVLSDTVTYTVARHSIKAGGEFRRFLNANFSNDPGSITFSATPAIVSGGVTVQPARTALQNFQAGQVATFAITPNALRNRVYTNSLGAFVVDTFKVSTSLTLEAGLRFEWNGTPAVGNNKLVVFDPANLTLNQLGTNGYGAPYKQNYNLEPRVGFIYDISGKGLTVIRGGYGLMADQPETNLISGLLANPPYTSRVTYTAGTTTGTTTPTIPLGRLYASAAASAISVAAVDPNYRNAYTQTYNLNVQHQFPWGTAFSIGYYGSVGRHLRQGANINQINPATGVRPLLRLSATSPIQANASINTNITEAIGNGVSNYNAMWVTARKNAAHGLQFEVNYQLSKSLDEGSQAGAQFTDVTRPYLNYGPSDFDTRHRISGRAIYLLPFRGNRLVEGFQLSGITQWQTGNPLNIITASTLTGTASVQRPNLLAPIPYTKVYLASGTANSVQWFANPSGIVCATPSAGCVFQAVTNTFGNMQRNGAMGPGFTDVDVSLEKNTRLAERLTLQLRIDAFDVFNHPNFANPGTTASVGSSSFGVITATRFPVADLGSSRQLQLAGKVIF